MITGPLGVVVDFIAAALAAAIGSLFAAGDAALTEIPEGRMQALSSDAPIGAGGADFRRFTRDPTQILSRWLVGRVVAISVATVLLGDAARRARASSASPTRVAVLGAVLVYGTFTEIVGTLARRRPERAGALALVFLRPLEWLLIPLADPLAVLGRAVGRRVPEVAHRRRAPHRDRGRVGRSARARRAGAIANGPAEMIRKVLDFKDLTAREVMVPRRHILGIELDDPALRGRDASSRPRSTRATPSTASTSTTSSGSSTRRTSSS